jgi:hypothetical protein
VALEEIVGTEVDPASISEDLMTVSDLTKLRIGSGSGSGGPA